MSVRVHYVPLFVILLAFLSYGVATNRLTNLGQAKSTPELVTTLPLIGQVLLSAGDRHLAANLAGFRVLVADTGKMEAADYTVAARLHSDIAWLNPAHEDNYYIAEAILPWVGKVDATQFVLKRAANSRTFDWSPLFYYGFGRYHFYNDPAGGAATLLEAVPRTKDQQDEWALQNLAANWVERGYDSNSAAGIVRAMAETSPPGQFRKYLQQRATRLSDLAQLRIAATAYKQRYDKPLDSLQTLVSKGFIDHLPVDPLSIGYTVDSEGIPTFLLEK